MKMARAKKALKILIKIEVAEVGGALTAAISSLSLAMSFAIDTTSEPGLSD